MHAFGSGARAGRGLVAWMPCLLAGLLCGPGCKIDSSVPDVASCDRCDAPHRCEDEVCVRAEPATPGDAAPLDGSRLDADLPLDASEAGAPAGSCEPGTTVSCFDGPAAAARNAPCAPGHRMCSAEGLWGACEEQVLPAAERCNELDDDCDGNSDESFDLQQSRAHCGACGNACARGQQCSAGECVDVRRDAAHCGACGNACTMDTACCGGECVDSQNEADRCGAGCVKCAEGQACCAGACADLASFQHCGACGNACDPGTQLCCGGSCTTAAACGP
jgi:Stigma-specific protein, Stig1